MDFDDLDEEINKRTADGEEVACYVVENNQPVKGTVLPPMTRSNRLPDFGRLPPKFRQRFPPYNGKTATPRSPVLRLLCIHGAADSYSQDWADLEEEAPGDIEVATYEFPGHGHREKEPFFSKLDELVDDCFEAFRNAMDTGAFALMGHSIGALIAIKVAKRARAELGVEPVFVIMMERGAAQHPLFTDVGAERLRTDPVPFFEYWNPMVYKLYKSAGEIGERTMEMWSKDQLMDNDIIEVGYHTFRCPMLALSADASLHTWCKLDEMDEATRALQLKKMEVGAYQKTNDNGKTFCGHFPEWTYPGWQEWTEHPQGCRIAECRPTDHMGIKSNAMARKEIWKALRTAIDAF
eukprot:gb/GFBE01026021.1/.p1 GENE.gb/GFBE01026021.1/~~gb/GFBE01026021.1/.p1  ORF type:complete len:351 (+),score=75.29 gb/GFBE01026021.1/:1-1053(+)